MVHNTTSFNFMSVYDFIRKNLKAKDVLLKLDFLEFSFSNVQNYVEKRAMGEEIPHILSHTHTLLPH